MTTRTHQSKTQSGTARIRSVSRSKTRTTSSPAGSRQSSRGRRRKSEKGNKGARVLLIMAVIGGVIGAIFILAQKLQINTLHLKRAEEGLKSEIDTYASQQRYLIYQKEKALSTQEAGKAANEFGLIQPGVGRTVAERTEPKAKVIPEAKVIKVAAKPAATKATPKTGKVAAKQPGKAVNSAKVITTGKVGKEVKPTQAKPVRTKKDTKQVVTNQVSRKAAQR